jgi:opacity protein-like surface antigen
MKKFISIISAVVLATSVASVASAEIKVSGDAYLGAYSKYLFRGIDLSGGQGVMQGGADITYKNFTLSYWSNYQINDDKGEGFNGGEVNETDITLNYSFSPVDLLTFNVGNTFYTFDGAYPDTNELYLKATVNTLLSPTLSVYWDWDEAQGGAYDGDGLFYTLSVGHAVELTKGLSLGLGALASYNQENYSAVGKYSDFHNYEFSVGLDYAPSDNVKISPSYLYSKPFNKKGRGIGMEEENVVGIKAAFIF